MENSFTYSRIFKNPKIVAFIALLLVMAFTGFYFILNQSVTWSIIWIAISVVTLGVAYSLYLSIQNNVRTYSSSISGRLGVGQISAFDRMPIGVMMLDTTGTIEWVNDKLLDIFGEDVLSKKLFEVDPQLNELVAKNIDKKEAVEIVWRNKTFSLQVQQNGQAIYMLDLTNLQESRDKYEKNRIVSGIISIDNYEEVVQDAPDSQAAQIRAYLSTALSDWAEEFDIYLRRLSADRYIFFMRNVNLTQLEQNGFKILDEIRAESSKQNLPLSLSIGVASGIDDLNELSSSALRNLDLALGRGGDQVVIRDSDGTARFIGGNSNPLEKRTRVRARMIAKAISDLIASSKNIIIMGHANTDMDSMGASLGIYRLAQVLNKEAFIVLEDENKLSEDVKKIVQLKNEEIEIQNSQLEPGEKKVISPFINASKARGIIADDSLAVLVDHSRPSISMAPEIIDRLASRLVVIDHHRVADEDFPQKPMMFYSEQYASSASELVTELLTYEDLRPAPITKIEASGLLSGIELDTKKFSQNTGTRTFDAASFLRAMGADLELIRFFGKEDGSEMMERYKLLSTTKIEGNLAFVIGEEEQDINSVTAAKTADSLLHIQGVDASFVITRRPDKKIGVNARSNGEVNVQLIMERIGGGGSLMNAAAQIENGSVAETYEQIKQAITEISMAKGDQ